MKLINSEVKSMTNNIIMTDDINMKGASPLYFIEKAGRLCYKSDSNYDKESGEKFFKQLVDSGHSAMLEHSIFMFEINYALYRYISSNRYPKRCLDYLNITPNSFESCYVSGSLRAIKESGIVPLMKYLVEEYPELDYYFKLADAPKFGGFGEHYSCRLINPTEEFFRVISERAKKEHFYTTFHFVCDRGVSHELVRHRPVSFAQESTRYCNYSKDKYGNELTFIKPAFFESDWSEYSRNIYINQLKQAEQAYLMLIKDGCAPQKARGVLPTDVKTEIIMTANHREWEHFFNLRYKGTTGKPHPNMKELTDKAYHMYKEYVYKIGLEI